MDSSVKIPAQWWANKAKLVLGQDFNRNGTENKTEIISAPACGAARLALVPCPHRGTVQLTGVQRRSSNRNNCTKAPWLGGDSC